MKLLNLYALLDKEEYIVNKLMLNEKVQREITNVILQNYKVYDYEEIPFDGCYKPDINQVFYIESFELAKTIKECTNNPLGTDVLTGSATEINALFTYIESDNTFIFLNIAKNQIISRDGLSIVFDKDTFKKVDTLAISIKEEIDCIYKNGKLYFKSYWIARQIFELSEYYNQATD